jgi:hypothetical protein
MMPNYGHESRVEKVIYAECPAKTEGLACEYTAAAEVQRA